MKAPIAICLTAMLLSATAAEAQETARFKLEAVISWSAETHPLDFPAAAHMSRLIGAAHTSRYLMFADGRDASSGLELVAENGRVSILEAELAEAARRKRVGMVFEAGGLDALPGVFAVEFEADANRRFVSFATMIAPSPDWFIGAASIPLRKEGAWIERIELPLWPWDAGTDSGQSYDGPDMDTQPRQSVRLLATPQFLSAHGLRPVGRVVIERIR